MKPTAPVTTTTDATIFHAEPRVTGGGGAELEASSFMGWILAVPAGDSTAPAPGLIPWRFASRLRRSLRGGLRRRFRGVFAGVLAQDGELVEVAAEHLHAARGLAPVVVLVDGVVAVLGQR